MIGLAFSRLTGGAENIGYIIPGEEIELFLADLAHGHYDGKPAMYDDLQTLENPALRSFLKLDKSVEGDVVHQPSSDAADYPLKQWDVARELRRRIKRRFDEEGIETANPRTVLLQDEMARHLLAGRSAGAPDDEDPTP